MRGIDGTCVCVCMWCVCGAKRGGGKVRRVYRRTVERLCVTDTPLISTMMSPIFNPRDSPSPPAFTLVSTTGPPDIRAAIPHFAALNSTSSFSPSGSFSEGSGMGSINAIAASSRRFLASSGACAAYDAVGIAHVRCQHKCGRWGLLTDPLRRLGALRGVVVPHTLLREGLQHPPVGPRCNKMPVG